MESILTFKEIFCNSVLRCSKFLLNFLIELEFGQLCLIHKNSQIALVWVVTLTLIFFQNELCHMIVDCCAQLRTYERFYGLLAERFCKLRKEFQECFERIARDTYHAIHRFEITKLRNMSKLIAHLLATDAISWDVLSEIRLTETDTTSSGRIYIKYLFEELVQIMSEVKVYERTTDP